MPTHINTTKFLNKIAKDRAMAQQRATPPNPAYKGVFNGNCNRTACQQPGAVWYNHSTRAYYCEACADMINEANHDDAMEIFGYELCTKESNSTTP